MSSSPNPLLDIESPEARQIRLAKLLADNASPQFSTESRPIGKPPTTFSVGPPTELLSRLQAFLPQIASANEALASRAPEDVDIENVGEGESQYVEMDLGLGVFNALMDGNTDPSQSAPPNASNTDSSSSEDDDDDDDSSDSSDEDDDSEETEASVEPIAPRKKVLIEEILSKE
ncbi:Protein of unknown function DUF4598 [Phaffia rhodozyma]|uniref:Uncharacterized protein n=1 Tax=Phaffia rhodozyma TaxID=264483 RepID=A0A0F7SUF4_PHARH|nr:Protein of unknown function DUF4598 [Phaffia rhodozyma]